MIIDAHQHFWRFDPSEFAWIDEATTALRRDFLPGDLLPEISQSRVDAAVSVQARQSLVETEWLLKLASEHPFICAVVGWVPLAAADVEKHLDKLSQHAALKAVRHVVQDEPNELFLRDERFNDGIRALRRYNLTYDLLIFERQMPEAIHFVDRHPHQPFVLDHLAKPLVSTAGMHPWSEQIRELARRENVTCKISGLTTEAKSTDWTIEQLKPYLDTALEAFGPRRLMFGSDWPVCLATTAYDRWHDAIDQWSKALSSDERSWLFGKTAGAAYRIDSISNGGQT